MEICLPHSLTILGGGQGWYLASVAVTVCIIWIALDAYKLHCHRMNSLNLSGIRKNSLEAL